MILPCPECSEEVFVNDHNPSDLTECPACESPVKVVHSRSTDSYRIVSTSEEE